MTVRGENAVRRRIRSCEAAGLEVELSWHGVTDVGLRREVNQDSYVATPPIFAVADGMGGHAGGDVASAIVVEEFEGLAGAAYDPREGADVISAALERSQRRIHDYSARQQPQGGTRWYAGTTAVVAMLVQDKGHHKWLLANLGDSRIYRLAGGALEQVSVDHSVVQELVDAGRISVESARLHPQRHVITRAVGAADANRPDLWLVPALPGDRLLICSDGISAELSADVIEHEVAAGGAAQQVADALLDIALRAGGRDNISIVVVDVLGDAMLEGATIPTGRWDDERTLPRLPDRDLGPGRHAADEDSQEE